MLFAFGGLYTWALVPLAAILLAGLTIIRPPILRRDVLFDVALIACVAIVALQLVPLPVTIRSMLSPRAASVERSLQVAPSSSPAPAGRPLSIRPPATAISVATLVAVLAMFWLARTIFERGGTGAAIRGLGWIGILVSVLAISQLATSPLLIYGEWQPEDASARPFGPFVNRNHMATWLLLAIPLTCGYLMAHVRSRLRQGPVSRAVDSTAIWQIGAAVIMVSALLVSVSRSGVIGLVAATITGFALTRVKLGYIRLKWLAGAAVCALFAATYLANFDALATRFAKALDSGSERSAIWRQTLPIVRDFPLTGTGAGTFNRAMLVYQQGDRQLLINQAHNHYLQVAAEGGLLVGLPTFCAIVALIGLIVRRLRTDTTAVFWTRAGATAGLVAVAVQSVWETGLRMPANSLLFAVCAALAVHESRSPVVGERRDPPSVDDRAEEELSGGRVAEQRSNQVAMLIEPHR